MRTRAQWPTHIPMVKARKIIDVASGETMKNPYRMPCSRCESGYFYIDAATATVEDAMKSVCLQCGLLMCARLSRPNAEITDGYRRPTAPNPPKSERR